MSGQNDIEVNPEGLAAELRAVEIPEDPGAAPAEQAPAEGGELATVPAGEPTLEQLKAAIPQWEMGAGFMVNALSDAIAPNWAITQEERKKLIEALCLALEAWFPGQYIPVKYQVLLGVGGAIWGIVTVRRQANGGKLPPLRLAPPGGAKTGEQQPTPPASSPAPAAGGGATTSV